METVLRRCFVQEGDVSAIVDSDQRVATSFGVYAINYPGGLVEEFGLC